MLCSEEDQLWAVAYKTYIDVNAVYEKNEHHFSHNSVCIHAISYVLLNLVLNLCLCFKKLDLQAHIILCLHGVSPLLECLRTGSRPARLER